MLPVSPASTKKHPSGETAPLLPRGYGLPFALVTALFFLWGIPNNLNDVLIKQFMKSFVITRFEAGLIQSAFYMGYFLLAMPAALAGRYSYFLGALFVIASGLSFLETAANPFIAQLGDPSTAARRLNLAQAFNPLGAVSGVLIGTLFIFSGVELQPQQIVDLKARHAYTAYLQSETMRVVTPYLVLGGLAVAILILIAVVKFPASLTQTEESNAGSGSFRALLQYPHFFLAVIAQFAYVGAQ